MALRELENYQPHYPKYPMYQDRQHAGVVLVRSLAKYRRRKTLLVLAISGPGVEVGLPIAQMLRAPMDLVISSLLPIPDRPESSFGAVLEDAIVVNDGLVAGWRLDPAKIEHIVIDARDAARHRMLRIRGRGPLPEVRGKTVVIVDDGLAVGFPLVAAVEWTIKKKPRDVVVAVPVAPRHEITRLVPLVSEVVCPVQRDTWNLYIPAFYSHWDVPKDDEVAAYLRQCS